MKKLSTIFLAINILTSFLLHSEIIIRPATLNDLGAINHLIQQTYHETFKPLYAHLLSTIDLKQTLDDFIKEKIIKQNDTAVEFITKQLNNEEHGFLVAYENNIQLIGCCRFNKKNAHTIHIYLLSVDKNFQRNGIGTQLLSSAINFFDNIETCTLRVLIGNDIAHNFYQKLNFHNMGTVSLDPKTGQFSTNPNAPMTHVDYALFIKNKNVINK